jgi:iron complex transport system substrate-binding protein
MIMAAVGATNIFTDAAGNWATVNWETVVERSPQVIVVIDADWDPAQQKIDLLQADPAYASIEAVQRDRFVILPFSTTTLGVRNVTAVIDLAKALYPDRFE